LGAHRRAAAPKAEPTPAAAPEVTPEPASEVPAPRQRAATFPTRDELTKAWGDTILSTLPQRPKARFKVGRFVSAADGVVTFSLPNTIHRDRCQEVRETVEAALAGHFDVPVKLRLVVDDAAPIPAEPAPPDDDVRPDELTDAPPLASPEDRIKKAFPGAEEVDG
jgi:hypothetical protein